MAISTRISVVLAIIAIAIGGIFSPWNAAYLYRETVIEAPSDVVQEKLLNFVSQRSWSNIYSANITVRLQSENGPVVVEDGRKLQLGDLICIENFFGNGCANVKENSATAFKLRGNGFGTTAAHSWEFQPIDDRKTLFKHYENWYGGISFLFMEYGPARSFMANFFEEFNLNLKESAEGQS